MGMFPAGEEVSAMHIRRFEPADAPAVSALITRTMRISNAKDYPDEMMAQVIARQTPADVLSRAGWTHFYVAEDSDGIVGCGAIGPCRGSETQSSLFSIFVAPEKQGEGIGRRIIETLERDEFALRAERIEIPASITAVEFYKKLGYTYKDGNDRLDDERLYRLEKRRADAERKEI